MRFAFTAGHLRQLDLLEEEISMTDYRVAPMDAAKEFENIIARVRAALVNKDWEEGAEFVSTAYSTADRLLPGIFDINSAKQLTVKLYLPRSFSYAGPMGWSKVWGRQDGNEAGLVYAIVGFLRTNEQVVEQFGQPYDETDDERTRQWWEFAIFDDERWHTFHLDWNFRVSLESGPDVSRDHAASTKLLALILAEFRTCASVGR